MLTKRDYTQQILKFLPEHLQISDEDALRTFWQDPRPDSGFRLTFAGYQALKHIHVDHYTFDVPPPVVITKPSLLLILSRKLSTPYFIMSGKNPGIVFFGSKDATVYSLYGDMNKFASMLKRE